MGRVMKDGMQTSFCKGNYLKMNNNDSLSFSLFGTLCAFVCVALIHYYMTDIDFIRLSALVFATKLIGKTADPISEGTEMAERLFNKIQEKEVQ